MTRKSCKQKATYYVFPFALQEVPRSLAILSLFCFLSPYYAHLFMCTHKIVNGSVKIFYRVPHLHLYYWRKKNKTEKSEGMRGLK